MGATFDASGSTFGLTLTDWGAALTLTGTVTASSATSFTVHDPDGDVETWTGTGFGSFNTAGIPTTGEVTGYELQTSGGKVLIDVTGVSVGANLITSLNGTFFNTVMEEGVTYTGSAFGDAFVFADGTIFHGGAGNDVIDVEDTNSSGTIDGGGGFNTLLLNTAGSSDMGDFVGITLSSIQALTFVRDTSVSQEFYDFSLSQIGGGLAANTAITGDGAPSDALNFTGTTPGTYDASHFTFTNWTSADHLQLEAESTGAYTLVAPNVNTTLIGGGGNVVLTGGTGNDILIGNGGDDTLNGGAGVDAASFDFNVLGGVAVASNAVTLTPDGHGGWTANAGADGTEQLTHIELVAFTDGLFSLLAMKPDHTDLNGDGRSDLLIENSGGSVAVGEVGAGDQTSYAVVAGLGQEWSFVGAGDFLAKGLGQDDFLLENTAGAVVAAQVVGGHAQYTQIASLGPEWKFEGAGDFLASGWAHFLIENTAGAVVVGAAGLAGPSYLQVASLGPEWKFEGVGDFLGHGKTDFLIENTAGQVVIGEVSAGAAAYTDVAGLGSEWKFVGAGDFLSEGHDQFLIENTAGAVDVGDWTGGQIQFTPIAGLGPEWKFVGTGDYLGEGHDQFLIENTAGAVDVGDWTGGAIHFTQVTGLGPEWVFH